jgi:hypothetical protein
VTSGVLTPPEPPGVSLLLGSMADESDGDKRTFDLLFAASWDEIDEIARELAKAAPAKVPLCVEETERARRLHRYERRLARAVESAKFVCANTPWLEEKVREEKVLSDWSEQAKLPLNALVRVVRGKHAKRLGKVMPFGQQAGQVLVGLQEKGLLREELVRLPRTFVAFHAKPQPPAPSAFSEGGALSLDKLWSRAGGRLAYAGG